MNQLNQEEYGKVYQPRWDLPIAFGLAALYLASMLWSPDPGYCRDEQYYFHAGQRYMQWVRNFAAELGQGKRLKDIRSLKRKEIKRYWAGYGNNHEHPPLAKLLMGASWFFFTQQWRPPPAKRAKKGLRGLWNRGLDKLKMPADRAMRFPGMLWAALIIFLVYIWGVQAINRRVALFAAGAMMLMPRFYFHAHLAAFDVPISALWLLVAYAFWRGMKSGTWALLCGVFFGLALATKHNSWILPFVLGLYWLAQTWNKYRLRIHPDGTYQVRFPPIHGALYASLAFGPLLLIGLWPLLWPSDPFTAQGWKETWKHLVFYVSFHLKHNHYDAYYFGVLHMKPPFPWHFPFGMTLLTFPLVTVMLATGGFWFLLRQQRIGTHLLWWGLWTVRNPIWSWFLAPLLSAILSLALLLPALLLGVIWLALQILETVGRLVPGGIGVNIRRGLSWLSDASEAMLHDVRKWNPWLREDTKPREYKPRPVGPADKTGLLWLLNGLLPIAVIALPSTPIFGGTKHWMTAWPFLALMAGLGFDRVCQSLQKGSKAFAEPSHRLSVHSALLACLFLAPALIGLVRSHPHGLAYYNTLIGGPRGSANYGMQRSFWAPDTKFALPWLNKNATDHRGKRGRVAVDFHDSNASGNYRRYGYLHHRIYEPWRLSGRQRPYRPGRYLLFVHQKWLRTQLYHALTVLNARTPVYGVYLDEAPLLTVWEQNSNKAEVWW